MKTISSLVSVESKVLDFDTGLPIENVNVYVKGANTIGTATDASGNFQLDVFEGETLVFSHQSYGVEEWHINDISTVVYMVEKANALDEVVITNKPKKNRTAINVIGALIGLFALYSVFTMDEPGKK